MRASDKDGQASGSRRVDERIEAMRSGRMNGTDVDSAGSGISTGESGAANLHLLYVVYSAVDSAGSGISVGEPGAANLHLLHARPSTQQGAAYRSASRELHICTSTDALISDRRPLGHASPSDSPTHALACVLRTMDGASRLADFVDENLCKPNGNTVLLPTTSPSLPNHYLQPSAPF